MASKKRSITFKDELQEATKELGSAMHGIAISKVHGGESKTVDFGVTFANEVLKDIAKRTLYLNDEKFDQAVTSIKNFRKALFEQNRLG